MTFIFASWPVGWSRQQRSTLAMAAAAALLLGLLWLIAIPLAAAPEPIAANAQIFADGTRTTVKLTLASALAGVLLGVMAALGKLSPVWLLRQAASFYIWVIRGTPLLVQILFVFLALPVWLPWLQMDDFTSACVALAFNAGAYNAESIRAGLLAVPKGQLEAAHSLGLSRWHTFADVIFPQAFKVALPPLVNNFIALLKDSSLAYAIGVVELTNVGNRLQAATFQPLPALVTTAVIYLALTTVLTQFSNAVEQRMDVEGRRR
ncbi:amino acid ABC transporter permease [Ralstonia solanacearum]|uniref:Putative glutamine transport system permease protein GlnP n=1 Tax=Ralstonia solanacearum CFBP2957 TaxID=859656 RepID=D8P305_RALSL|nr:amino acid ABC transporter permease [Ralstonia solanacearum]AST34435.1 amino acid ABC transporter permease [Ralstonia solanacearum]AYB53355.1 amino acid ABC transporter permease [Ralstonia solanacearum]AYB57896.1 amino acid ABC transporter permease [Ralstonia solanacearum]MBB6593589.1 amino acid ABC transporter permease [Ralstonia solanacearum]MBB6597819.1 amino acid ABC transporter permease [Ralstonia solanacearum]